MVEPNESDNAGRHPSSDIARVDRWRKALRPILIGPVVGPFTIYLIYGKKISDLYLFILVVLGCWFLAGYLFLLINFEKCDRRKYYKLIFTINVISIIPITVFLSCPWWVTLTMDYPVDPKKNIWQNSPPVQIFAFNCVPFIMAFIWFVTMYGDIPSRIFPKYHKIIVFGSIILVGFVMLYVPIVLGRRYPG